MKKTLLLLGLLGGFAVSSTPLNISNINNLKSFSTKETIKKAVSNPVNGFILNINFIDDYGNTLPLKDLKIEIHKVNGEVDTVVKTTYTNGEGIYQYTNLNKRMSDAELEGMYYFRVFTSGYGYKVGDSIGKVYTWDSPAYTYLNNETYRIDQTFTTSDTLGQVFALTQCCRVATNFGKVLNDGDYLDDCAFYYPSATDNCYYLDAYKVVKITNITHDVNLISGTPNPYYDIDTVCHEYGHHVQNMFNLGNNPALKHYLSVNCEDSLYENYQKNGVTQYAELARDRGLRLAYSEGWATAFGLLAQKQLPNELRGHPFYGDSKQTQWNGVIADYGAYQYASGEGSEDSIISVLYNIFDKYEKRDPEDELCEDVQLLLECARGSFTISDFLFKYKEITSNFESLCKILAKVKMSPSFIHPIKKLFTDEAPTFKWDVAGGSKYYTNNEFFFHIESELDEHFASYEYELTTTNTDYMTFTVPLWQWRNIITTGADYFTVYVNAFCDRNGIYTGSYGSQSFTFEVPHEKRQDTEWISMEPADWKFPEFYTAVDTQAEVVKDGYYLMTNRLRTGRIDRDQIVLSPKKKGEGLAYFQITTEYPLTRYRYQVSLWSASEGINPNNSRIVVEFLDEDHVWREDLRNMWEDTVLSTDRNNMNTEGSVFGHNIYGIRWTITAPATGSHNNGRLCLKNISLGIDK